MKAPSITRPGLFFLCFFACIVAGCRRSAPSPGTEVIVKRNIVCVVYPEADIVRQVAGEQADLRWQIDWLCEDSLDPRDLELTEECRRLIHQADLIITSGYFEPWTGDMLSEQETSQRVITLDSLKNGHRETDQHSDLWLDPLVAMDVVDAVRERLSVMDDRRQFYYRQQADNYLQQLKQLDADFTKQLAPLKGKEFMALRPTWLAMVERYGLSEVAPVDTTPQKLTDDEVKVLQKTAKDRDIQFLAVDASVLPGVKRELQLRTGLTLLPLDALGTSASEGRSTYLRLMRYNLEQITQAFR